MSTNGRKRTRKQLSQEEWEKKLAAERAKRIAVQEIATASNKEAVKKFGIQDTGPPTIEQNNQQCSEFPKNVLYPKVDTKQCFVSKSGYKTLFFNVF